MRRPDAHELGAIRDGALRFEELRVLAQRLRAEIDEAARRSSLPDEVDRGWVDSLALEVIGARLCA